MIEHILLQSLLFLPLCFGIYISFSVLKLTDLTTDGSFVLGAGTFAVCVTHNVDFYTSLFLAICAGAVVGVFVSYIQKNKEIDSLIAGIVTLFMLQGINLLAMGKPNISLLGIDSHTVFMRTLIPLMIMGFIVLFFSNFGLIFRGFGENDTLLERFGYRSNTIRTLGLMLSNSLAAFSGVLTALEFGYADLSMGMGVTLTGMGAIMVGQYIIKNLREGRLFNSGIEFCGIFLGVGVYFSVLNGLLMVGVDPIYLKIVMGLLLLSFLGVRSSKRGM